ncbi:SDR family NAD(P)-dependent oxidoreductase [Phytomonospora sp. NPDC050363]|uniref:SDR family NAD(P)-dependent oxidoreductase n=1 Tax=Phytomonospora sp. NPDC050363 TaxID=3155642 RepID=UPI0033D1BCA0
MTDDTQTGTRTIVISGGTDGMGRALALGRIARGDTVVVIGSSPGKGAALRREAGTDRLVYLRADLTGIAENRRVVAEITGRFPAVDALVLFANRPTKVRKETADGLESVFALYYLSRHLLSHGLRPLLESAREPVIVSVAGVGNTAGAVQWEDMQLKGRFGTVLSQLHGGRATDLLGVAFAERTAGSVPFLMYHPGFTRSGDTSFLNPVLRIVMRGMQVFANPVAKSVAPIHGWIESPPREALTAIDRGNPVDLSVKTLDPADARRLDEYTEELLRTVSVRKGS